MATPTDLADLLKANATMDITLALRLEDQDKPAESCPTTTVSNEPTMSTGSLAHQTKARKKKNKPKALKPVSKISKPPPSKPLEVVTIETKQINSRQEKLSAVNTHPSPSLTQSHPMSQGHQMTPHQLSLDGVVNNIGLQQLHLLQVTTSHDDPKALVTHASKLATHLQVATSPLTSSQ
ncbi:hypothetical protein SLA2020_255070 [Shorea laevis]